MLFFVCWWLYVLGHCWWLSASTPRSCLHVTCNATFHPGHSVFRLLSISPSVHHGYTLDLQKRDLAWLSLPGLNIFHWNLFSTTCNTSLTGGLAPLRRYLDHEKHTLFDCPKASVTHHEPQQFFFSWLNTTLTLIAFSCGSKGGYHIGEGGGMATP